MSATAVDFPHHRQVFFRALLWSTIGITYTPLFVGLDRLFNALGAGHWSVVPAAALTISAVVILPSARQLAVAASLVGVMTASFALLWLGQTLPLWSLSLTTAGIGMTVGLFLRFPHGCTWHVGGKVLTGLVTGALCGTLLALLQPWVSGLQTPAGAVAFLISINGVVYVASVRRWIAYLGCTSGRSCQIRQALVISLIATLTAVSVWVVAGSVTGRTGDPVIDALLTLPNVLPPALMAGVFAGVITGMLLELFQFRWVHDA